MVGCHCRPMWLGSAREQQRQPAVSSFHLLFARVPCRDPVVDYFAAVSSSLQFAVVVVVVVAAAVLCHLWHFQHGPVVSSSYFVELLVNDHLDCILEWRMIVP